MQDEVNEKVVALSIKGSKLTAEMLQKDTTEQPPRYLVFFKGRDADVLTAAFKEFSAKKLTQEQRPSIRKALAAFRDAAKQLNASRQKVKNKEQEVSL